VELPVNTFKHALKAGKRQIGLWCSLSHHYATELVAGSGFDWILLDTEHSPNDLESVAAAIAGGSALSDARRGPRPLERHGDDQALPGHRRAVDPDSYVQNADEAKSAVAYTRYPPAGLRGVAGGTRATRFARVKDYAKRAHEELCVLVQVENQQGLDNLEKIAAVEGVDGVFIGPADLHASLGYPGETNNPKIVPIIDDAIRRIRKAGKAPGILTGVEADARRWLECGGLFVAVGADVGVLARETEKLAAKFKS